MKKSQTLKKTKTHFYLLNYMLSFKMTSTSLAVVNVYLRIFVEDIVALLGAMTDKWVRKLFCGRN